MQSTKEIKKRYFDKVLANAEEIECACGCKTLIKNKDKYGRDKKYVSGHNTPTKYEDPTQHKREWNHRNRPARMKFKKKYHLLRKIKLMELKGSKCFKCGIQHNGKNGAIFHFHHRDPKEKEFMIGNQVTIKAWATLLKELDKCDMLCANCHEITHSSEF